MANKADAQARELVEKLNIISTEGKLPSSRDNPGDPKFCSVSPGYRLLFCERNNDYGYYSYSPAV
jgi:hypothetical protein